MSYSYDTFSSPFNATMYSMGYIAHLLQDYVGHHTNGFLNPNHDHALEFAVDALVWKQRSPGFKIHNPDQNAYLFVANATLQYSIAKNQSALYVTADTAQSLWSKFKLLMSAELLAIDLDFSFENDIFKYDVCNASSVQSAMINLQAAQNWMHMAVAEFLSSTKPSSAKEAVQMATNLVEDLFLKNHGNNCATQ
jgi:hypothetical protein